MATLDHLSVIISRLSDLNAILDRRNQNGLRPIGQRVVYIDRVDLACQV